MLGDTGRGQGDPRPPPQTRAPLGGCSPAPSWSKLSPWEPRSLVCPCRTEGNPAGGQQDVEFPRGSQVTLVGPKPDQDPACHHPSSAGRHQLLPFKPIHQPSLGLQTVRGDQSPGPPSSPAHSSCSRPWETSPQPTPAPCLCPHGWPRLCPGAHPHLPPPGATAQPGEDRLLTTGTQEHAPSSQGLRSPETGAQAEEIQQTKALETKAGYISRLGRPTGLRQWLSPVLGARPRGQPAAGGRQGRVMGAWGSFPSSVSLGVCGLGQVA